MAGPTPRVERRRGGANVAFTCDLTGDSSPPGPEPEWMAPCTIGTIAGACDWVNAMGSRDTTCIEWHSGNLGVFPLSEALAELFLPSRKSLVTRCSRTPVRARGSS
jgi:hypothetical protein